MEVSVAGTGCTGPDFFQIVFAPSSLVSAVAAVERAKKWKYVGV